MAQEKLISPPLRKPVQEYLTPDFATGYFTELIDRTDPAYKTPVRGMPYASIRDAKQWVMSAFPDLYFVRESRWRESDQYVLWIFGSDPKGEDTYNSEDSYGLEDTAKPGYTRVYTVRREVYNATPSLAALSPLKTIIALNVTNQGSGYTAATVTTNNGASVTPVISNGKIVSLVLTSQGADVTSAPTVTITGDGTSAAATAVVQNQSALLVSQKKVELPEQHPLRNEYVQVVRTYSTLPGHTLTEQEYIPEINAFIYTQKTIVANTGQTPSRTGGTGGADLVVTEYKDIDANLRVQIVSTFPAAIIGKSWTFRAPLSYPIPAEISATPVVTKLIPLWVEQFKAMLAPALSGGTEVAKSRARAILSALDVVVADFALNYDLKSGYTKNFSATVTRTLSMSSSTETEYNMFPEAYARSVELALYNNPSTAGETINITNRLKAVEIPHCIHPAWTFTIGKKLSWILAGAMAGGGYIDPNIIVSGMDDIVVNVPATIPSAIPYGTEIIAKVSSSLWRGALYVNDVYKIVINKPSSDPVADAPTFSLPSGTYTGTQTVVLSCDLAGATIVYTLDGSQPTQNHGTVYTGPINLVVSDAIQTILVRAIAYRTAITRGTPRNGYQPSLIAFETYVIQPMNTVATPTFSPAAGSYDTDQAVELSTVTSGATIHYTIDGTTPTALSPTYSTPIPLVAGVTVVTTTIKALAVKAANVDSSVATAVFNVGPIAESPTFSPAAGSGFASIPTVTITTGTSGADIFYTIDGTDPTTESTLYTAPFPLLVDPGGIWTPGPSVTLKAIAVKTGMLASDVASGVYSGWPV